MGLRDFAQRGRTFTVDVTDARGDVAPVEGRALLGDEALEARNLLRGDSDIAPFQVIQMICPELEDWEIEDIEHLVNRCGGLDGGFGELFRRGLGQHRRPPSEVGQEDDSPS